MIYLIYDFNGLKITKKKYQQYFETLLYTAKICELHSDDKPFKIKPVDRDFCIDLDKMECGVSPHHIDEPEPIDENMNIYAVPDKMDFSRVRTASGGGSTLRNYDKCIVCAVEDSHELYVFYNVQTDRATVLTNINTYVKEDIVLSFIRAPVPPFESRASHDRFLAFNPGIRWMLNDDFWNEFWLNNFHEERLCDKDILIGALRYSMVGLFYDKLGNDECAVKASPIIGQAKHMCIWPQLENDIQRHFKHVVFNTINDEGFDRKDPKPSCQAKAKPDPWNELIYRCKPSKDFSGEPPKWLTHLYIDSVENDGEFPDKKKLHDLLDHMVDYVGSWTGCNDAHSAQQMKDILPLLVRCKIILEKELEYFRASKEKKE